MFPVCRLNKLESAPRVQSSAKPVAAWAADNFFYGKLYGEKFPKLNQFLLGTLMRNFSQIRPSFSVESAEGVIFTEKYMTGIPKS